MTGDLIRSDFFSSYDCGDLAAVVLWSDLSGMGLCDLGFPYIFNSKTSKSKHIRPRIIRSFPGTLIKEYFCRLHLYIDDGNGFIIRIFGITASE